MKKMKVKMLFKDKIMEIEGVSLSQIIDIADGRLFIPLKCDIISYDFNEHPVVKRLRSGEIRI